MLTNLFLSLCSAIVLFALFELVLWINKTAVSQKIKNKENVLDNSTIKIYNLPDEWKTKEASVSGAKRAFYWHGKLHILNKDKMRRASPFPAKKSNTFRIIVIGDSFTYGQGVAEKDTYPKILENLLKENYRVEVLNLGTPGYQIEDLLELVKKFTPKLKPNLIIYGVCHNDFLPSGKMRAENNMRDPFPIPRNLKTILLQKSLTGAFLARKYNDALIKLGIRESFISDILKDFNSHQKRFSKNAKEINNYILNLGLPPIIAMVLDQCPGCDTKQYNLTSTAEKYLSQAGMTVIPTKDYYAKYWGQSMIVSSWEKHPNEKAHRIFANYFFQKIKQLPEIQNYKL